MRIWTSVSSRPPSVKMLPRLRFMPWCISVFVPGVNFSVSRRQFSITEVGQMSSIGRFSPRTRRFLMSAERLHRLAEAHVVGEARAHAEAYEAHEPREPFLRLIGAQPPAEAFGRVHLLERRGAGEQRAHRVYPRRARDG